MRTVIAGYEVTFVSSLEVNEHLVQEQVAIIHVEDVNLKNPISLVISITLYVVIIGLFLMSVITANIFSAVIKITVPVLILVTILGFIYSFFIKGKQKIPFLILHFISLCTISFSIYLTASFQDFAP
ncbi:hypothetical protein QJ133_00095 [Priestia megaterium]|uniref:hypothetical protein n=1 Tax=Priestia megaterium TaxID=1404 RepID=UPI00249A7661|nr:hypothetical protein [Priestia megaterium]MDI3089610.1 hypothetical protein [Priestia megaterium]